MNRPRFRSYYRPIILCRADPGPDRLAYSRRFRETIFYFSIHSAVVNLASIARENTSRDSRRGIGRNLTIRDRERCKQSDNIGGEIYRYIERIEE